MGDGSHNFSKKLALHGFSAHEVDVFAAAVVVDVVESVRVGEACFVHFEQFGFVVHVADEFEVVEAYTFVILGKINTSNFYLNKSQFTLDHRFIAYFVKIEHSTQVFGDHCGGVVSGGQHETVQQVFDCHPGVFDEVSGGAVG